MRLTGDLARSDIEALLVELGAELDSRGTRGELFVIGGAAMALAYDTRRSTRDIDGVFEPKSVVYAAAAIVGSRHGLDEGWLNAAAKAFITPTIAEGATVVLDAPGIRVSVPATRTTPGAEGCLRASRPRQRRHPLPRRPVRADVSARDPRPHRTGHRFFPTTRTEGPVPHRRPLRP